MTPDDPVEEVVVVADPLAVDAGSSQVTAVDPSVLPAATDLAHAVEHAPGVVVRRLGGPGDVAQVGIRGIGARYTEIWLDGIPLNPEGGAAVDLSELPLSAFERVEVYRGAAPALFGTTGLGGGIALVPVTTDIQRIQLGLGAFDTMRAAGTAGFRSSAVHGLLNADVLRTSGAFPYYDDRGTLYVSDDDRTAVRSNNDTGQGTALLRVRTLSGPVRLGALYSGLWREEGVPGFTDQLTDTVRYAVTRHLLGVRANAAVGATSLALRGTATTRAEVLSDPLDAIGVGKREQHVRLGSVGVDGQWRTAWSAHLDTGAAAGLRADRSASDNRLDDDEPTGSDRLVGRAAAAATLRIGDGALTPALIGLWTHDGPGAEEVFVLPRLGWAARFGAVEGRANAGAFARPPDLLERYGDNGAAQGNPDLRAERAVQVDAGASGTVGATRAELVAFLAEYRDQIVWVQGSQGWATPENLARSGAYGIESAIRSASGRWTGNLVATLTMARDRSEPPYVGKVIPRVPLVGGTASVGFDAGWAELRGELFGASRTWADRLNVIPQPARLWLGGTVTLRLPGALALELDVQNLANQRSGRVPDNPFATTPGESRTALVDFVGYPLPGRSWTCTVRWQPEDR